MVADIGDPSGGTGTGVGDTVPETQRDRTTGMVRYLVADEVVTLVEGMGITAEAAVREGDMVQTPNPSHQDGQKIRGGNQNSREGGRSA